MCGVAVPVVDVLGKVKVSVNVSGNDVMSHKGFVGNQVRDRSDFADQSRGGEVIREKGVDY